MSKSNAIASVKVDIRVGFLPLGRSKFQSHQSRSFRANAALSRQDAALSPAKDRGTSKVWKSADEAVADIKSGSTVLSAGFGLCGTAGTLSNH